MRNARRQHNDIEIQYGFRKPRKGEDPLEAFSRRSVVPRAGYFVDGGSSPFANEFTRKIRQIMNESDVTVDVADVLATALEDAETRRDVFTHGLIIPMETRPGFWRRKEAILRRLGSIPLSILDGDKPARE